MDLDRVRRQAHLRRQQAPTGPRSREGSITDPNYRLPGESVVEWRRRTRSFSVRVTLGGGDTAL